MPREFAERMTEQCSPPLLEWCLLFVVGLMAVMLWLDWVII
jgi:hypothetical protein